MLLEENETLTQIVNDARRPPDQLLRFHQSISRKCPVNNIRMPNLASLF